LLATQQVQTKSTVRVDFRRLFGSTTHMCKLLGENPENQKNLKPTLINGSIRACHCVFV